MAITANRTPYVMTAIGDDLASVFQGRDALDSTPVVHLKVSSIRVIAGGAGQCLITNGPGGDILYRSKVLDAGDEAKFEPARPIWFEGGGFYIADLPGGSSEVHVYVD